MERERGPIVHVEPIGIDLELQRGDAHECAERKKGSGRHDDVATTDQVGELTA